MFLINPRSILISKKLAQQSLFTQKLQSSFSLWKKTKHVQSVVVTQNKKGFLKDINNIKMKNTKIVNQENKIIQAIKQNDHSNFLKAKKKVSKNKKRIKTQLDNSQHFLFQSKFHKNEIDLNQFIQKIQKIDEKFIKKTEKQELIAALVQISKERQKILMQNMTKEKIYEQLLKFAEKSQESLKIQNYVQVYNRISQFVEKILNYCEQSKQQFSETQYIILSLISSFNLLQFYTFYLYKLLYMKDKNNLSTISVQEAKLCWFIVQRLSQIQFKYENNKMNYDLQKYVQQFFEKKLQIILQKVKSQLFKSNQTEDSLKILQQEISFLINLEKIFKTTHLTLGKLHFYTNFVKRNIHHFDILKQINEKQLKKRTQNIAELFYLSTQNLFLDPEIIEKFETYFLFISKKFDSRNYLSDYVSQLLFDIYQKIGSIPDEIYDNFLAEYIYNRFSKDEYNLVQCLKFYVFSQCDDKLLLQSFLNKIQNLINSNQFTTHRKTKHMLHFLFHYLCIKYPRVASNSVSRKILGYCMTNTPKNHQILSQIMKLVKKPTSLRNKKIESVTFTSPCIQRESRRIENNIKSDLSTLQENIFKDCLEKVVEKLNTDPDQLFYYEIKQQFSFCSFELDFVILKWDSQKKQKLFSYLDIECVGLQYSYDRNVCQDENQIVKKMQTMSIVQYEKGLQFIRKKKIRQQILKHYGWRILYVPNKFLYKRHMSWSKFQQKLSQAILTKFYF